MKLIGKRSKKSALSCDSRFEERERDKITIACIKKNSSIYLFLSIGCWFALFRHCSYTVTLTENSSDGAK